MTSQTTKTEQSNRVLASLNYFSIFFAGFLFPLIVWIISKNDFEKYHAKRALISHVIALLPGLFAFGAIMFLAITTASVEPSTSNSSYLFGGGFILILVIYFVVLAIIMIWNVIQGIKVLRV
ncbi:DUF4870 domain-containing protein [Kurthia massiliensis]|uniref:DUF4870 domain-containing protein n=1 Tax=Kurthia massiliensis TaxID=1033739 RepID=UPI00028899C9|nr:DUF4870 domain-containing protein [Kurthia massiliensis]